MAGDEHEAEQVVADVIVDRGVEIRQRRLALRLELVPELLVLAIEHLAAAQLVDRPMLRGGHQPGARVVRYARRGPALERRDERVMSQVLRHTYVAHHPRERGDQLRRLDPPDGVDRLMGLGCRHRFRSFCATRALTSFRTSAAGRGLSAVKRMVPLDVSYDASSCLNAFRAVPGKKLQ